MISRAFATSAMSARKQFVLIAYDATDPGAYERRLSVREAHLARSAEAFERGSVISGGAILTPDQNEKMCGSVLVLDFPDMQAAEEYVKNDPYVKNNVWGSYTISPFKLARFR